jgi:hypothetical protein
MKTFAKISSLLLFAAFMFTAIPFTKAANDPGSAKRIEMRFLKGDHVTKGSSITAELSADTYAQVSLVIENSEGKLYGEKLISIENGAKLVRFRIAEVPAGLYYIKLNYEGKTQSHPFVIQ